MKKLKKIAIWLIIIGVVVFGIWQWKFQDTTEPPESTTVSRDNVRKTISINATLVPEVYANIGAETLGEVKEVFVQVGDEVTKGQKLATLDQSTLWSQINSAKLAIDSAVAQEQEARNSARNVTKANRLTLKNASEQARQTLNELYAISAKGVLTSPISGTVSIQNARVGEIVTGTTSRVAGVTAGTVIRIIDPSSVHIEAFIAESDIVDLKVGQDAIVLFDAYNDEPLEAKITQIDPEAVNIQDVIYFRTLFALSERSVNVRPGMTGDVDIITAARDDVLTIPLRFIRRDSDGSFVWIQKAGSLPTEKATFEKRVITTGVESDDGLVEILSGLTENEQVFIIPIDEQ